MLILAIVIFLVLLFGGGYIDHSTNVALEWYGAPLFVLWSIAIGITGFSVAVLTIVSLR